MSEPDALLSLVTLGVANLKRSIVFYEALGFRRKGEAFDSIGFFQAGACQGNSSRQACQPRRCRDDARGFDSFQPAIRQPGKIRHE